MEVRDPIHGAIRLDSEEAEILKEPFVQRMRGIAQLGFAQLPFPGATHTRFAHSLGVMELAGRAFDAIFRDDPLADRKVRASYRRCVRLAALLHDLGHGPQSHCAEFAMPLLRDLGVQNYEPRSVEHRMDRSARHEDYTVAILTRSSLSRALERIGCKPEHIAALVSQDVEVKDRYFHNFGLDFRPLLSGIVSSDLDVDRLDYLVRDSYYTGASYGHVDVNWLISNMGLHVEDERVSLALDYRAIYAFDHYILSRYHMFVMVYFHHKSVIYEEMLRRHLQDPSCRWRLPANPEAFLACDDVQLNAHLRTATDRWARAIAEHRPWVRVLELHGNPMEVDTSPYEARLGDVGIEFLTARSMGQISGSYPSLPHRSLADIYVVQHTLGAPWKARPLRQTTQVFERYHEMRRISRIYVPPEDATRASEVLTRVERRPLGGSQVPLL